MSELRIVLVTETWVPDINGVSLSLYQLMQQLYHFGQHIYLICPKPSSVDTPNNEVSSSQVVGDYADGYVSDVLFVKGLPIPRYPQLQFGMPSYRCMKAYLQEICPDVIHIATEGPLGLMALILTKRLNIAVTTGYHTQFHDFSRHFGLGLLAKPLMGYLKYFHNWSDATCVPSQKTNNDLAMLGFKRLVQVGRGVDIERFQPSLRSDELRVTWGAGQQHTVLLVVCRLSPEKGVDMVIEAYKALQLKQLYRAVNLVIVGDGPDRPRLQALAEGHDDIVFAGTQTGQALAVHYASADAFVFASQVETFGNVVIEAMASGLPVYAFDDAAAATWVDEDCGRVVPLGDKAGFIEMVSQLSKSNDLKQQGMRARQKVLGLSWQEPAMQMLTMFFEVINKQQRQPSLSQPNFRQSGLTSQWSVTYEKNKKLNATQARCVDTKTAEL